MIPEINLLPKYERKENKTGFLLSLLFILWVTLLAFSVYFFMTIGAERDLLEERIGLLTSQKEQLEAELEEKKMNQLPSMEKIVQAAERLRTPVTPVLYELQELLSGNGSLMSFHFNGANLSIQVDHPSLVKIATFMELLEMNDMIARYNLNSVHAKEGEQSGAYSADFEMHINPLWLLNVGE